MAEDVDGGEPSQVEAEVVGAIAVLLQHAVAGGDARNAGVLVARYRVDFLPLQDGHGLVPIVEERDEGDPAQSGRQISTRKGTTTRDVISSD